MNQNGILSMVARVEGGPFYTTKQVADRVGRSRDTIKRWRDEGSIPEPKHKMDLGEEGKSFVWLYTEEDAEMIEAYATVVRPGRPKRRD